MAKKKKKKGKKVEDVEDPTSEEEETDEEDESEEEADAGTKAQKACVACCEWQKIFAVMRQECPSALVNAVSIMRPALGHCSLACPPVGREAFGPADDFDKLLKATTLSFDFWVITAIVHILLVWFNNHFFIWSICLNCVWMWVTYVFCIAMCKNFKVTCLGRKCGMLIYMLAALYNFGFLIYECVGIAMSIITTGDAVSSVGVAVEATAPSAIELFLYLINVLIFYPVFFHSATCAASLGWNCIAAGAKGAAGNAAEMSVKAAIAANEADGAVEVASAKKKKKKKKKKKSGN